jgi:branched-chain amino acid aminotransferase
MPEETAPRPRAIAWMDGRVVPATEATVPLLDDGFLRGDAVFDAILVQGGRTHALDAHLDRLRRSAKAVGIQVPTLGQVVTDLLAAWGEHDGSLKIIVTRGRSVRGLIEPTSWAASVALEPVEMPWGGALPDVKTLSYAANMWATREARSRHADDAVIVSGGIVHELPTAAIAWVRDGRLRAPDPGKLPILDSITLAELRKVADVTLGAYALDDLLAAEEAFVLSASRRLLPVHAIGDVELPAPGDVTARVREDFLAKPYCTATEPGGRIALAARRDDGEAVISVRDNGVGIAPELVPRLFDMFAQADRSRAQGGLGIGLALARRLTELHGGRIEARSDGPGQGSEFIVRLPLSMHHARESSAA